MSPRLVLVGNIAMTKCAKRLVKQQPGLVPVPTIAKNDDRVMRGPYSPDILVSHQVPDSLRQPVRAKAAKFPVDRGCYMQSISLQRAVRTGRVSRERP